MGKWCLGERKLGDVRWGDEELKENKSGFLKEGRGLPIIGEVPAGVLVQWGFVVGCWCGGRGKLVVVDGF